MRNNIYITITLYLILLSNSLNAQVSNGLVFYYNNVIASNQTIVIENCNQINSGCTYQGYYFNINAMYDGDYNWYLYKDGQEIEHIEIPYLCSCNPFNDCLPVGVSFDLNLCHSGEYKIRLIIKKKILIGSCQAGLFINTNQIIFDQYSSSIMIQRFDDISQCKCEYPENANMPCILSNLFSHYFLATKYEIFNTCTISANKNVINEAGQKITLQPGFHAHENSYYRATIIDCINVRNLYNNTVIEEEYTSKNTNIKTNTSLELDNQPIEKTIYIYPNPTKDILYLKYNGEEIVKFYIYDIGGKIVFEGIFIIEHAIYLNDISSVYI